MVETVEIENAIIGAGVIGLAIGAELARKNQTSYVFDMGNYIGAETSSRNSEVIHSGIYYPPGSFRSQACIEGSRLLYDYCDRNHIAYKNCGKLVVATSDTEISKLEELMKNAKELNINGLELLDEKNTKAIEPEISARASLKVPSTGIIDSHSYLESLAGEISAAGGAILLQHRFINGEVAKDAFYLNITNKNEKLNIKSRRLFLACGLWNHSLASQISGYKPANVPALTLAKGSYFSYSKKANFNHLIYPVPVEGGLGIHLTFDMNGSLRFGPDVEWLESNDPSMINYTVNENKADVFYQAVRRYWPGLPNNSLSPDFSGVRPKLSGKGQPQKDFLIETSKHHNTPGLFFFYGIESPGLTSSLAIAKYAIAHALTEN